MKEITYTSKVISVYMDGDPKVKIQEYLDANKGKRLINIVGSPDSPYLVLILED